MPIKKDGSNIIISTDIDKVLFADLKNKQSCSNYTNSLSGTFQASNLVCSILVNNGQVINNSSAHSWLGYPDSCLICYKDGTVIVKRVLAIAGDELPNVKWAISGVGLLDMYNPEAEGYCKFTKNGKTYDYSDVVRKTNHTVIGVDTNNKVYGLYLKNMTGKQVNDYCQKLGLTHAVMLDGGHIASVNCDIAKVNVSQKQSNIIQFILNEENNSISGGGAMSKSVVLDAGHGGSDPGAIGKVLGLKEKDVTLKIVKLIKTELERCGVGVYLTRDNDKRLVDNNSSQDLTARAKYANEKKADIFVSIHNNSASSTTAGGIETYCYKFGANAEKLARAIQTKLINLCKPYALFDRGVKTANFAVLRETTMPAILIEINFLSNKYEEGLLNKNEFLSLVSKGIAEAICEYLGVKYIEEPVHVDIPKEEEKDDSIYKVQLGAFSIKENADNLSEELKDKGYDTYIVKQSK